MATPTPSLADLIASFGAFTRAVGDTAAVAAKMRGKLINQVKGMEALNQSTVLLNRGLSSQIGFNQTMIDQYVKLAAESMVFENRNKELNKTFGISSMGAAKLSQTIHKLAKAHGFSGEQALGYAVSIKKMLPTFDQQNLKVAKTAESLQRIQHLLTTNLGLTEASTEAYSLYASKNGENADTTLQFAASLGTYLGDADGTMGYMKMAIEGIAGATADTQLQFGKIPGNLELATIKAKSLGFELDDLAATGKSLLNIESSIGDELEYQLLSGHRLVDASGNSLTNAYREATLRGNMSDAASTLNTILENEGDVLENNLFAREKMAKLMGIEEGQLSRALQKKKLLSSDAGLSVLMSLDGEKLQTAAEGLLASGKMSEKAFKELSALNDTRTTDDIMKQQLIVAEESLAVMTAMLTQDQADMMATNRKALLDKKATDNFAKDVMSDLSKPELETLGGTENLAARNAMAQNAYNQMGVGKLASHEAGIQTTTPPLKDAVIPAGYGSRILSFPEDSLQADVAFKNNDTIIAGTSLAGGNASSATPGAATDDAIMTMARMIVAAINSKGSNLFGATSMNNSTYPS